MSEEKLARRDAVKVVLDAYQNEIAVYGKLPGDAQRMDPIVKVPLRMSTWEAIYKALKPMMDD